LNFKLFIAADFLLSSNDSISEVAQKTGFNNRITFIKAFKKQYHLTPTEFRRKTL